MAEALGEVVTPQRLQIYATDLATDLSQEQLRIALTRARRECRFFPKIAELREFAGGSKEDHRKVEAEAAWTFVMDYLRRWSVARLPLYQSGKRIEAPPLSARIEYALRRIGGLRGLNQITESSRPFMFKDFCEAYQLAPVAESQAFELHEKFGESLLLGATKLLAAKPMDPPRVTESKAKQPEMPAFKAKSIPEPLTDAQLRDRRQMLKQQASSFVRSAAKNS